MTTVIRLMEAAAPDTIRDRPQQDCDVKLRTLDQIYRDTEFVLSYELFPPKTDAGVQDLKANLQPLLGFGPDFITCTFGAGGSARDRTLETLREVASLYDGPLASHLTCVGMSTADICTYLDQAREQGIRIIVAIRGDQPQDGGDNLSVDGPKFANELVSLIRERHSEFGLVVGGYPEVHPEAASADADIENLKRKVDAGADVVVTQLFYDNDDFFRFRDRCDQAGIDVPIVPGLLPASSYAQLKRITALCGATLPSGLESALQRNEADPAAQFDVGVDHACEQALGLVAGGIPGIHFYVLNKCRATIRVLQALGTSTNSTATT